MKKLISLLIVTVMVFAAFEAVIPAAAVVGSVDTVEVPYFDVKPTIDGIVSEAEWGESSVYVDRDDAATIDDTAPVNNRFFMRNTAAVPGFDQDLYTMQYELWMRWDENFYYVAAKVKDPDGHSLKNGRNETWNGDALQFRMDPEGYNASSPKGAQFYDAESDGKPWSKADVADVVLGFVESAGGFSEAWSCIPNTSGIGLTPYLGGSAQVSVAPSGAAFSSDTQNGYTTYEIAVPWSVIDTEGHTYSQYTKRNKDGGIGKEYGMSAVVYNADGTSGQSTWNAALSWGSGILNPQQNDYTKTCAGSNSVELVEAKVSEDPAYSAGYPSQAGGYVPAVSNPNFPTAIDTSRLIGPLTYDNESDMEIYGDNYWSKDGAAGGQRIKDTDGNWVVSWNEDTGELFNSPTEFGLNESNYLSTQGQEEGTYTFDGKGDYTMEFDVKVIDTQTFESGYKSELYNWFGGVRTVEYMCGYSFDDGQFFIKETDTNKVVLSVPGTFSLNEWHHWVFQYYKDNSSMRFYFDPPMKDGKVDPAAKPLIELRYRYFDMPGVKSNQVILRRMNCQILLDNVKFYNFVDFSGTGEVPPEDTRGGGGGYVAPVSTDEVTDVEANITKRADGTFALAVPNEEKYSAANVTAVKFTVDLTKADGKLTFKGVEGLEEDAYDATDNGDGTVTIKIVDLKIFSNVEKGKDVFSVILAPVAGTDLTVDQVKEMVSLKATVTTTSAQTGDAVVAYVGAALLLIAVIGTGVVLYSKKRRRIDF